MAVLWAEVAETPQEAWLPYLSAFLVLFGIFWLIDPILKETLPSGPAHILLTAVYLFAAQVLIATSGGVGSPFSLAYLLVIFTGAMALGLSGGIGATFLSGLAYASFVTTPADGVIVVRTFLGFLLVAMMIGFLSETKRRVEARLVRQSALLDGLDEAGKILRAILDRERILAEVPLIAKSLLGADTALLSKDTPTPSASRRDRISTEIGGGLRLSAERDVDLWGRGRFSREEQRILDLLGREVEVSIEWARLQENLRRKETLAAVGEMSARVAHEIRNPLAGITGYLSLALRDIPTENPVRRLLSEAASASEALSRVVSRLLDFTRASSGGGAIAPRRPRIRVDGILDGLRRDFPSVAFEVGGASTGDPPSREDEILLREILRNLLENAVEATGTVPILRLRNNSERNELAIEVRDDGPGVPADFVDRIFQPFATTKARGTGLGLAIARRAAQDLGGRVEWEREGENGAGNGTTVFRLVLCYR